MLGIQEALITMAEILKARFGYTFGPKDKSEAMPLYISKEDREYMPLPSNIIEEVTSYEYRCEKCGKKPQVILEANPANRRIEISFRCHGEIDSWTVSEAILNTIRTSNPAIFKIKPFSRIMPAGFKLQEQARTVPKKEWKKSIDEDERRMLEKELGLEPTAVTADNVAAAIAIAEQMGLIEESIRSNFPEELKADAGVELRDTGDNNGVWMDDEGKIYGKGRVGAVVRMQSGERLGMITAYQPDRKTVIINVDGRGPTEFPALNPSIAPPPQQKAFPQPRKPVLKTKLSYEEMGEPDEQPEPPQIIRPSIPVYYNGQITMIDVEGMEPEIRDAISSLANAAPAAVIKLLKAGAFRFEEAPKYVGRSTVKESELRTIDLKKD